MTQDTDTPENWKLYDTDPMGTSDKTSVAVVDANIPSKPCVAIAYGDGLNEAWDRAKLIAAAPETQRQRDALLAALEAMVEQECDYMKINKLGDPEEQHNIIVARAAIKDATS